MLYDTCLCLDPKGPALFGAILEVYEEKNTLKVLLTQRLEPATKKAIAVPPVTCEVNRNEIAPYHESLFGILFDCGQIEEVVSVATDKDIFSSPPVVELIERRKRGSAFLYFLHAHFPSKDLAAMIAVDPKSMPTSGNTKGSITTRCIPLLDTSSADSRPDAGLCIWTMDELQVRTKTLIAGGSLSINDPDLPCNLRVSLSFKLTRDTMVSGIIETFALQDCRI